MLIPDSWSFHSRSKHNCSSNSSKLANFPFYWKGVFHFEVLLGWMYGFFRFLSRSPIRGGEPWFKWPSNRHFKCGENTVDGVACSSVNTLYVLPKWSVRLIHSLLFSYLSLRSPHSIIPLPCLKKWSLWWWRLQPSLHM